MRSDFVSVQEDFGLTQSPLRSLDKNISSLEAVIRAGEHQLSTNDWEIDIYNWPYGVFRLLKAGGLLQIREYEQKKSEFVHQHRKVPKGVLAGIDEKLTEMRDMVEQGVLNGLEPAEILLDLEGLHVQEEVSDASVPPRLNPITQAIVVESDEIPIIDEELKSRCLSLLRDIVRQGDESRLDTVVSEMSRILENRIRQASRITDKINPEKLMVETFNSQSARLIFSEDSATQQSAFFLYKGYFGFFRNEVMHRLVKTYTTARVYQLLGYVDYLLFLLTQAEKSADVLPEPTSLNEKI